MVVPTIGRPALATLLDALDAGHGPAPEAVVVVDDRRDPTDPLPGAGGRSTVAGAPLVVVGSCGRGPATARDIGWRLARTDWVAFLDDDVVPTPGWRAQLDADLAGLTPDIGGSQGRIRVPRPAGRRPNDWERNVIGLERACWATADLAYRADALGDVGGFDRRFPRAFREDADLGLRVTEAGWTIVRGTRETLHPVRPADRWVSVRLQRQNRDDQLMGAIHGPAWRARCSAGPSRNGRHLATTAAGILAIAGVARRTARAAALGALGWLVGTAELAYVRTIPGPRTGPEVLTMLGTSALVPAAASWHLAAGLLDRRRRMREPGPRAHRGGVLAVLFDRDGTLIVDVPYNGAPERVEPVAGAAEAVRRLRERGIKVGVITNQSGVARGLLSERDLLRVNRRVDELIGPMDTWQTCTHGPGDGCRCRKPQPGLVEQAAAALGVPPSACVVVGDIGADVDAARTAGARAILVPTGSTRADEIDRAPETAPDLAAATDRILGILSPSSAGVAP